MADETEETIPPEQPVETPENSADSTLPEVTPPKPPETPTTESKSTSELEILSEQFQNYWRIAQAFLKTLKRPKDIEVCNNLLDKAQRLNGSKLLDVRRNNNIFFRYCLKVLKWTSDNQPLELYKSWYRNVDAAETVTESHVWLEDNKSYMAIKHLKDGTTIIYSAVADDPSAGWQDGGLNILAKRGFCLQN